MSDDYKITIEEQWIEREGKVYRRQRIVGKEWCEWELTAHLRVPLIQKQWASNHDEVMRSVNDEG